MKRLNNWLVGPAGLTSAALGAALLAGCQQAQDPQPVPVGVTPQAQSALEDLAEQCGIDVDCSNGGILEGRANVSGVASVDAFFGSVVNFQAKASTVSAAINAELAAIRADFGIAANANFQTELRAKIQANVEGELQIDAEPARCTADVSATLEAQARCDAEFTPGSAMVECKGSCEVEASASVECSADAELSCTFIPPGGMCEGSCSGTCAVELDAAARCDGVCKGTCSGSFMAMDGAAGGGGKCDGMCMGTCETEVSASAGCEGSCQGECTITEPEGGCEGAIRAECKAEADAMVMCSGRCEGEFEPPMAKAECQASAKAEARMNVECTPPSVAINYRLKAGLTGEAELAAQAEFVAAVENLKVRLPALLAAVKRAESVGEAGASLAADAGAAVKTGVMASASGDLKAKDYFGLLCAVAELDDVGMAVEEGAGKITASVNASASIVGALGL